MAHRVRSITIAAMILFTVVGCTQVAYDTLRNSRSFDCQKLQSSADREECMKRADMSYEEYQRQLDKQKQGSRN